MDRMFSEPKEFVKVEVYVVKDTKAPYNRYFNFETGKWGGLLAASRLPKEEMDKQQIPENGEVLNYDVVIGVK